MRNIIIGDVHGCNRALCALLEKVKPGDEDRLILLGDLFDRGPESWEVFETVKALEKEFGERFVLLRGNHEDYLLQEKLTIQQKLIWERVGRGSTVKSFREHGGRMEDAIPWLKEHCRGYWKGEKFQCVHAGLKVDPIEANDIYTMIHDHLEQPVWFTGDGENAEELVYGEWMPLPDKGIICIDTGCGKGGTLSAMEINNAQCRMHNAQ